MSTTVASNREKDLIVFARAFHQSGAFQSLASLIASLEKYGRHVHLITQSEPCGDDYVSSETLRRYSIDVYETRGYSTEEAFFKMQFLDVVEDFFVRTVDCVLIHGGSSSIIMILHGCKMLLQAVCFVLRRRRIGKVVHELHVHDPKCRLRDYALRDGQRHDPQYGRKKVRLFAVLFPV